MTTTDGSPRFFASQSVDTSIELSGLARDDAAEMAAASPKNAENAPSFSDVTVMPFTLSKWGSIGRKMSSL